MDEGRVSLDSFLLHKPTAVAIFGDEPHGPRSEPSGPEKAKAVSSRRKSKVFLQFICYQAPSIVTSGFLAAIYNQGWFWTSYDPSTKGLQLALQFAAKIHEALIILSLTHILIHRLRFFMLRSDGIPLGILSSPTQLSNPLYFVQAEFRGGARGLFTSTSGLLTLALVVSSAIIALAAGPLAATLVYPREGVWIAPASYAPKRALAKNNVTKTYVADGAFNFSNGQFSRSTGLAASDLHPKSIGPELGVTWSCPEDITAELRCVSFFQSNLNDIYLAAMDTVLTGSDDATADVQQTNLESEDMSIPAWVIQMRGTSDTDPNATYNQWGGMATSPLEPSFDFILLIVEMLDKANLTEVVSEDMELLLFQSTAEERLTTESPVVLMQMCTPTIYMNDTMPTVEEVLDMDMRDCFREGIYPACNFTMTEAIATAIVTQNWTEGFMSFIDAQDAVSCPISAATFTAYPNQAAKSTAEDGQVFTQDTFISIFVATWGASDDSTARYWNATPSGLVPAYPKRPFLLHFNTTPPSAEDVVVFDSAWMNSLDVAQALQNGKNSRSLFRAFSQCERCLLWGVPAILANIMSMTPCRFGICVLRTLSGDLNPANYELPMYNFSAIPETTPADVVSVVGVIYESGYAYSLRDGSADNNLEPTIVLGFVVLYIHIMLVVIHIGAIVLGGFWTSTAWSSLSEVVLLALRSSGENVPLEGVGAGIQSPRTWRRRIAVRQQRETDILEVVVSDGGISARGGDVATENVIRDKVVAQADRKYL